jgi:hypothetical protein
MAGPFTFPVCRSLPFDSLSNNFPDSIDNAQDAIEYLLTYLRLQSFLSYQFIGDMTFSRYLFAGQNQDSTSGVRPSGDGSTGYQWTASAPLVCPFDGTIQLCSASIRGLAVGTGTKGATVNVSFEIWKVGFASEGTLLHTIQFPVNSTTFSNIGLYGNVSLATNYQGNIVTSLAVTAGDLLALKFKSVGGSNNDAVGLSNATINLNLVKNA